ncbi:MAG: peptidylprolyl isomerase [bacterium]
MPTNKQRREAARRKLERQLQARQERARRRRQANLVASIVGALVVVAVVIAFIAFTGKDKSTNAASTGSTSASPSASPSGVQPASYPCKYAAEGKAAKTIKAPTNTKPARTGSAVVSVKTNRGPLTFTLDRKNAPCTVNSFVSLVKQKYYDDTKCHRLSTEGIYVLQCGDPSGTGGGTPGYTAEDEYTGAEKYGPGVLAMANTGSADTNGSQFFIVYKDSSAGLQPKYTVFGKVTAGLPVVNKVAAAGVAGGKTDGAPKLGVTIQSMTSLAP